jgi:hypothetical protein
MFIREMTASGGNNEVKQRVEGLLESQRVSSAMKMIVRSVKQTLVEQHEFKAMKFCERKLLDIGRDRMNKANEAKGPSETIKVTEDFTISPVKSKSDSYKDSMAIKFIYKNVPYLPKVRECGCHCKGEKKKQ